MEISSGTRTLSPDRFWNFLFADDTQTPLPLLVLGAGLSLAIAIIHLQDQGGLLGNQSAPLLRYGFYMVEISSTIAALLIVRGKVFGWVLGLASSIGPMTGYVLTRTVGVPGDNGDIGNWGYLLGTVSLVVEGSLIVLSAVCLRRIVTRQPHLFDATENRAGQLGAPDRTNLLGVGGTTSLGAEPRVALPMDHDVQPDRVTTGAGRHRLTD
jgi:hypothetical protein